MYFVISLREQAVVLKCASSRERCSQRPLELMQAHFKILAFYQYSPQNLKSYAFLQVHFEVMNFARRH